MEGQKADSCIHEINFMILAALKGSAANSFNNELKKNNWSKVTWLTQIMPQSKSRKVIVSKL